MIDRGKHPILGVLISAVDYEYAVEKIVRSAQTGQAFAVTALAVHGVMTGFLDPVHRRRLNGLDLVVPDGQPVRWGLRWRHRIGLADRVYGPELTLRVAEESARQGIPLYLYGSTEQTLRQFVDNLTQRFPKLIIVGQEPSKFRKLDAEEKTDVVKRIKESGAKIVLVGLGCPRQEVWVYEYRNLLNIPLLAVGAAFDFHAGSLSQAPPWMQKRGLEWLYRLLQEPKRLWRRYLILNPLYLFHLAGELLHIRRVPVELPTWREKEESFG